ncbi:MULTISPECIES: cytochrome ubiquinol oxidase subunit I [Asaia]|uniref:Cytochrome ubiquinol oxidase subunit I n=2 Tax=Asaia bogorensis TaxID=91915 RepID=A0AAN4R5H0_9PROT|nr:MULTISPECIES: cytochrome ubiquinol oxidase subunit I [Asaia]ETC99120.1 cytochrome D ubiquinol oxidase subunit I [Asaia sp. SF2.1]MDL2171921.1 cytochrome ubiquinol oxidase subunit I [Asaia sp. HumB]NIE81285.1 cytochrome ubiquinol oxidase subunit I [Asaia sp. As-1742]CDG39928.1 Cytochrome bd2, subunit I [Asaia bogorensis]BAT19184.1 cytochrome d ubiquinol oxidase subunit I [Asaia bogorensis NBRC 16594]
MPDMSALFLARLQFAFTVGFHIVFPAFSIGLAAFLAVLEGLWLKTDKPVYLDLFKYWLRVFSVVFAMGVVSGLVMSYEFGTNWSQFSQKAGPILGPMLAYEVMTAFFLEAGFLGVMMFGLNRVGKRLHFAATCMVSIGTLISMSWILASNSWMQTPQGYKIDAATGRFLPADWFAIVFNPSFPFRLVHMALAAFLCVAFIVGGVGAWHLLKAKRQKRQPTDAVKVMFSMAMWMAAIVAPLQILAGDAHGLNTLKYQPAKIAAMEGDWESESRAPELLFGVPDMEHEVTRYKIGIPLVGSLILTHSLDGKVPGLKDFPKDQRAPMYVVFYTFRVMVALGSLMALLGFFSLFLRWKGGFYTNPILLRGALLMTPAGFIALLCGWVTTEVGRQPFTIYGLLRTVDSVSPVTLPNMEMSMVAFVIVYFIVFTAGIGILLRDFAKEPSSNEPEPPRDQPHRAAGITQVSHHPAE